MRRITVILLLVAVALCSSVEAKSVSHVMPKATATHFCQLLVCDGEGAVYPISSYIHINPVNASDSLTQEQLFCTYVFSYDGWKTLRIFPHSTGERVDWYAPSDELPSTFDKEHQKYISEVLPRMKAEVLAGNWQTVDAYIDRLLKYQTTFGTTTAKAEIGASPIWLIAALIIVFLILPFLFADYKKR